MNMETTLPIKGQKKLCLPKTATYPNATSQTKLHQTVGVILNYQLLEKFLYCYPDHLHRRFAALPEQTKLRAVSEMELHETCQMSDQEGSPSAEEQLIQPFNKYRLKSSMSWCL